jgi:hypothetical protein
MILRVVIAAILCVGVSLVLAVLVGRLIESPDDFEYEDAER